MEESLREDLTRAAFIASADLGSGLKGRYENSDGGKGGEYWGSHIGVREKYQVTLYSL